MKNPLRRLTIWQLRYLILCLFFLTLLVGIWLYFNYRIGQLSQPLKGGKGL
ncbi:MAG: hypothetical protein U0Y10_24655 [Spirosomataceae bacterium]